MNKPELRSHQPMARRTARILIIRAGISIVLGAMVVVAGNGWRVRAQTNRFSQLQQLFAPDGGPNADFGGSVAISGDTAVIGAFAAGGNSDGAGNGAVYVFVRTGGLWSLQQELPPPGGAFLNNFGTSVAIDVDSIVVGAPGVDLTGAAYVFLRTGGIWSLQQKLTASDAPTGFFGGSVAISGDTVVVGNQFDQVGENADQGSASVFVRAGGVWSEQQKLTAPDGTMSDFYGNSVAISGDTVVVGDALADRSGNTDQGAVYVYVRASGFWSLQQTLTASDAAALARFGASVAIAGDTLVAGNIGSTYVFARIGGAWSQQQKLPVSGLAGRDSVAISGETIVVGAEQMNSLQGAAYVFVKASGVWGQQQMLTASDGKMFDKFGSSVSIDGETIVVGAGSFLKGHNVDQGSAYIFTPNTPPTIAASSVTVKQGRTVTGASIATVSDNETSAGLLAVSVISGGTATGVTLANIANSSGAITADVAASCTATSGTLRLLVTDPGGLTDAADLQVNVTPNDPPVITCPSNLTVVTAHPGDATAIVTYPAPLVIDICPVSLVCTPPSGSAFPAGVTTVTCTATDASGNKATCGFQVIVVNYCLLDNTTGNLLQWSSTGDYFFTRCKDKFTLSGKGTVSKSGGFVSLTDSRPDRRISAAFNPGTLTGRANITLIPTPGVYQTITISQTNPAATCACP